MVHKVGQPVARPRPLAELGERGFVYVDDPNRLFDMDPRRKPLKLIHGQFAHRADKERIADAQQDEVQQNQQSKNEGTQTGFRHSPATIPHEAGAPARVNRGV
jgi:hypothetical protein